MISLVAALSLLLTGCAFVAGPCSVTLHDDARALTHEVHCMQMGQPP